MNELRPMSVGEILDRAIQMMKANLGLFVGIAVLPDLANLGYSLALQYEQRGAGSFSGKGVALLPIIVLWVAYMVLIAMAAAAKCWAASQLLLGRPATVRSAYGAFKKRKGRLVGLGLLQGILSFWPMIPASIVLGIGLELMKPLMGQSSGGVMFVGMVLLLLLACAPLYARYLLAFPATAVLDLDANASLRRSVELGRGFRWKVFWAFALPVGIGIIVAGGSGALISLLQSWHVLWTPVSAQARFFWSAIGMLGTFAINLVCGPLGSIALTLTYYDLCVRKEGLDIVHLMEHAGLGVPAELSVPADGEPA
ncbi:MAG TPA: hypothetical protein VG225_07185 [Terracidiphilus sp.]|jgi:hypothetical protein|nr:hypothetical protein [Terracidiphilus sp.]